MRRKTPVQVILIRRHDDPLTEEYATLLKQVFRGGAQDPKKQNLYFSEKLSVAVPLRDPDLTEIKDTPLYRRALLDSATKTIAVVIRSRKNGRWPAAVEKLLKDKRIESIVIQIPGPVANGTIQLSVTKRGGVEPSFIPIAAALATLEKCRLELIKKVHGRRRATTRPKLFVSHAKADGMAMAHALVSLLNRLQSLPGFTEIFKYFYDAESIQPGDKWRKVLSDNAGRSLFLALRTEEYESRYWCRQEFLWAEKEHMPMLVVDLRRRMYSAASSLPLDGVDSTRISDGNLVRVLFHALRSHIAHLQLRYRVEPGPSEVVLPRYPSSVSIEGAIERLAQAPQPRVIVYAGDTLPAERAEAIRSQLGARSQLMSEVEWEMAHA